LYRVAEQKAPQVVAGNLEMIGIMTERAVVVEGQEAVPGEVVAGTIMAEMQARTAVDHYKV
jgi:hypothetical protein